MALLYCAKYFVLIQILFFLHVLKIGQMCQNGDIAQYIVEAYSQPYQKSKMECLARIINSRKSTIFAKRSFLDVSQGSEYSSV